MHSTRTLQEVIFAVHFSSPAAFTVMDLADWARAFEPEFPNVQQLPPLDPVSLEPQADRIAFNFGAPMIVPRLLATTQDQRFSLQVQNDRVAFGWRRLAPFGSMAPYPGYDELKSRFADIGNRFREWWSARLQSPFSVRLVELNYSNAAPMRPADGKPLRLSEVCKFVRPLSPPRVLSAFQAAWAEPLDQPWKARIAVSTALGTLPDQQTAFFFTYAGVGEVDPDAPLSGVGVLLDALHAKILEIHTNAINSEAFAHESP